MLLPDTQVRDVPTCKLLISLVGAGRFERPTPCAQGSAEGRANLRVFNTSPVYSISCGFSSYALLRANTTAFGLVPPKFPMVKCVDWRDSVRNHKGM